MIMTRQTSVIGMFLNIFFIGKQERPRSIDDKLSRQGVSMRLHARMNVGRRFDSTNSCHRANSYTAQGEGMSMRCCYGTI